MRAQYEARIRDAADPPTIKMLDLWHQLCREKFGTSFELLLSSRHDEPKLAAVDSPCYCTAELINASIGTDPDVRGVLVVYLERVKPHDPILFTHEVAHWVLEIQGFGRVLLDKPPSGQFRDGFLSMCHHKLVYERQRECGHDPQGFIDHRARYHLGEFGWKREAINPVRRLELAVVFADDLLSCAPDIKRPYLDMLWRDHPRIAALTNGILQAAADYDPLQHYRLFAQHALWRLGLRGGFEFFDRVKDVRLALAARASGVTTQD